MGWRPCLEAYAMLFNIAPSRVTRVPWLSLEDVFQKSLDASGTNDMPLKQNRTVHIFVVEISGR
jgi:hypothetical protein